MVDHWSARDGAYFAHRQVAGSTASIIIGDSITEGFLWNTIGPERIVNAGYGGINASQMLLRVSTLNLNSVSRKAIVLLGTNDAVPDITSEQIAQFASSMNSLVANLKNRGTSVFVASIPPIEPNKSLSSLRSQESVDILNSAIVYNICPHHYK